MTVKVCFKYQIFIKAGIYNVQNVTVKLRERETVPVTAQSKT